MNYTMPHLFIMTSVLSDKLQGAFSTVYSRNELFHTPKLYTCISEPETSMACEHTNHDIINIFYRKIDY